LRTAETQTRKESTFFTCRRIRRNKTGRNCEGKKKG